MNAYIAPTQAPAPTPAPAHRHRATAPWVLAALSPVAFVVLMETFEVIAMSGSGPDIPDAVGLPLYFVLVALLPATAVALGVRAIRRGDRGKPWVPTILSIVLLTGLVVMAVAAIVAA